MCFKGIIQNLFSSVMYQKALTNLSLLALTAIQIKKISITSLGRGFKLPIQERSCIRRADRFVGNPKIYELQEEFIKNLLIMFLVLKQGRIF